MNETIGNRISKFRKEKHMTQEELANLLGVSSQAVSKWETDTSCPDISLLPQLAKALGVTIDELVTGKNDEVKLVPQEQRKSLDELTLRIKADTGEGDKVRVNLPMSLVKVGLEIGMDMSGSISGMESLKGVDFSKLIELVERGVIGKLVEVESADGDIVEIVVE